MSRQKLGQHFLHSNKIAQEIAECVNITKDDTVLEVGTGRGILTGFLCKNARSVISIEADRSLYEDAVSRLDMDNLELRRGDGFKADDSFTIFASNLPYYKSKRAIEWLARRDFLRAVIMVQKEFADKITSKVPGQRKAISVIAGYCFEIKPVMGVSRNNFDPPPKVDSVVLLLVKKKNLSDSMIKTINLIFSYRRKTIQNILEQFDKKSDSKKRLDELDGDEIIALARQITQ